MLYGHRAGTELSRRTTTLQRPHDRFAARQIGRRQVHDRVFARARAASKIDRLHVAHVLLPAGITKVGQPGGKQARPVEYEVHDALRLRY